MLTFSRGRRGEPRRLALAPIVRESVGLLRASFPATVALETDLDENAPEVMHDPVQLEQVLMNLAINARDAMHGSGAVRIGVGRTSLRGAVCASCRKRIDGDWVELGVADTGPGIAPDVQERMFEPFFTTKEVGRGSGMGLATVHGIVHEHRGHVVVESEAGRGSRFRVLLPGVGNRPEAGPSERPLAGRHTLPRAQLCGRVAVVDDEPIVAGFMCDLLATWGLEVTPFPDASSALAAFIGGSRFDLVITDHTMPGMTGIDLARRLRASHPGLPIVLYTGFGAGITPSDLQDAGISALIDKPIDPSALLAILRARLPTAAAGDPKVSVAESGGALT